ncbi:MAG: glutathione peroxidase [Maribacter sp.]|jgi:glutathione peroxidase
MEQTIHQFTVKDIEGNDVSLEQYKGKVLLIVNTASKCGFTPQLNGMKELYEEFKGEDFEILAFPSNDFAGQEPLDGKELAQFCMVKYEAEYPIFDKVHVKGKNASALYQFLSDKDKNGKINSIPKWNFHKYIIDKEGKVVDYYLTITKPTSNRLKKRIKSLL